MQVITLPPRAVSLAARTRPDAIRPKANNSQKRFRITDGIVGMCVDPIVALDTVHKELRQFIYVRAVIEVSYTSLLAGGADLLGAIRIAQHGDHFLREISLIARFGQ